ncbi:MAG: iron-sulfur cluster carrier protein ApbC [Gammaproteobacteria bacterium]|nr:MAG: iron-sulfur cluster carrier protein ApbC [Gammaproteobacteria bacterium]
MSEVSRLQVEMALKGHEDPYLGQDLVSAGALREVRVAGGRVEVELVLGYPVARRAEALARALEERLQALEGVAEARVRVRQEIRTHAVQQGVRPLPGVRNIVAVASGKGGVGKSTTAVNLALALAAEGARAGVLDADIYGPSIPRMLGAREARPRLREGRAMEPVRAHGLQAMSLGFLVEEEAPAIWRGPMATQALQQLLGETAWEDLDYLVVDLPPGTGDVQLTLAQRIPVSGAVIVTTPQDIALLDARKALRMFEKVNIPVLGVVENMSLHICSRCGHQEPIFGSGGGERMAAEHGVPLLGQLPLDIRIREQADSGRPTVVAEPEGPLAQAYREAALRLAGRLARRGRDYSARFPNIVIEND